MLVEQKDILKNPNSIIRESITNTYNELFFLFLSRDSAIETLRNGLLTMYRENPSKYNLFVAVMLSNLYMMLHFSFDHNTLDEDERNCYDALVLSEIGIKDIIYYIEVGQGSAIFEAMIEKTLKFDSLTTLGKITIVQNSKPIALELISINPMHIFDVVQYGGNTDVDTYLAYYNEHISDIAFSPRQFVEEIANHMRHLYTFDKKNYMDNLIKMSIISYKWSKYILEHDSKKDEELANYVNMFEHYSTLKDFVDETFSNFDFLFTIVGDYCYYETGEYELFEGTFEKEEVDNYNQDKLPKIFQKK